MEIQLDQAFRGRNPDGSKGVFSVVTAAVAAACERGEELMNQQNNNQNQNPSQQQREQQQREQQQREQQQRERQNNPGQGAGQKPSQGGQNIDKSANQGNNRQ
jgi:hypothetical protein